MKHSSTKSCPFCGSRNVDETHEDISICTTCHQDVDDVDNPWLNDEPDYMESDPYVDEMDAYGSSHSTCPCPHCGEKKVVDYEQLSICHGCNNETSTSLFWSMTYWIQDYTKLRMLPSHQLPF